MQEDTKRPFLCMTCTNIQYPDKKVQPTDSEAGVYKSFLLRWGTIDRILLLHLVHITYHVIAMLGHLLSDSVTKSVAVVTAGNTVLSTTNVHEQSKLPDVVLTNNQPTEAGACTFYFC